MKDKTIYIFGHKNPDTDSISSSIAMANYEKLRDKGNNKFIACRLGDLNPETKFVLSYFKVDTPKLISKATEADAVILVDHNSPTQSSDDIKNATVIKVIDHHSLVGFETTSPIFIYTKAVGSTPSIIYELYQRANLPIDKKIAGLMLSALLSDTNILRSPSTTQQDIIIVKKLAKIAGVNYEKYGMEMLMHATDTSEYSEEELINLDSKNYFVNGYNIQIACTKAADINFVLKRKTKLLEEIKKFSEKNKLDIFLFAIVDILELDTTALVYGNYSNLVEEAFKVKIIDYQTFLDNISTRKGELYPILAEVLSEHPKNNNTAI